jgi:probable HAF family extracellular repeat protein
LIRHRFARHSQGLFRLLVAGALVCLLCHGLDAAVHGYRVTYLGELQEAGATFVHGLSYGGQVVGESGAVDGAGESAFGWKTGGVIRALGVLPGGDYSQAFGVNDQGLIVGSSNTSSTLRAVVWSLDGRTQEIGTLPGDDASQALGVNSRGQVVGYSSGPRGTHAFLWTQQHGMQSLRGLPGSDYTQATAINDSGEMVGTSGAHAVLWVPGHPVLDLGTLPGDRTSSAAAINNLEQVVGSSGRSHRSHGFFWTRNGGMHDVGVLPGGNDDSQASGINDAGEVVGQAGDGEGNRAFLWTIGRGLQDLNLLLSADSDVHMVAAIAINDHGQITGYGAPASVHVHHFNAPRAYLLTPSNVRVFRSGRFCGPILNDPDTLGNLQGTAAAAPDRVSRAGELNSKFENPVSRGAP